MYIAGLAALSLTSLACATPQTQSFTTVSPAIQHISESASPSLLPAGALLPAPTEPIVLSGEGLTIEQVAIIARSEVVVEIAEGSQAKLERAHQLLLLAAKQDQPVYGLNRGVGLNKDKSIFEGDSLGAEALEASENFNLNMLRSHASGVGPDLPEESVRAILAVRLNTMLVGRTGVQPKLVAMYAAFLNKRIHPVVPSRGSVGEADISLLPHIGLAMAGEGEVYYQGQRMPAAEALAAAGLEPLRPFGKDSLSILSSNAVSSGLGALVIYDAEHLLRVADQVFALSLEGLNGNVAPLLPPNNAVRPYQGQGCTAAKMRTYLQDSYLWSLSDSRPLQDPLSFRSASQIHGATHDVLQTLIEQFSIQLNSSDDNPVVIVDIRAPEGAPPQEGTYYVDDGEGLYGAVMPTASFEPIPWVIPYESLGVALSHVSRASVQRTIHLVDPKFTKLSRFLSPNDTSIAFGTIQKSFVSLHAEIRSLSNPVSADSFPVAGGIEDHATNAPMVVSRVGRIVDNLYYVLGIELMHAAQAMDLRHHKDPKMTMGAGTAALHAAYREQVSFLDKDRILTYDIEASYRFLTSYDFAAPVCVVAPAD